MSADRLRPWSAAATVAGAVAVIVTAPWGYAAHLLVVAALALVVVAGWPAIGESHTPLASSAVLALAAAAMLAATARPDVRWLPAAVALGIVAAFLHQLLRPPPRDGLVRTVAAAFGGLLVLACGALLAAMGHDAGARPITVVVMIAVAVATAGDLLVPVRAVRPYLSFIVLLLGMGAAVLAAAWSGEPAVVIALGAGAGGATVSWSFRRVLALQPALLGAVGQVAVGAASVLLVGAFVRLFALLS